MKPRHSLQLVSVLSFFILLILLASCKKDPYEIGINLLPSNDTLNIKRVDTTTVFAYSELQDSIRSDKTTTFPLGSLMDPVFGSVTASFFTQFALSTSSYNFGTSPVLDSVVLALQYSSAYGDTNAVQCVKVYEISQDLNASKSYYSNQSVGVYPVLLASKNFVPALHDSVRISNVQLAPHLRINLNKFSSYFGNKLLSASSSVMSDNASFAVYMKGLYIESVKTNYSGGLVYFDPLGTQTKLIVYFHNENYDSLQYIYQINSVNARFGHIDHNQYLDVNPDVKQQVVHHDTTLGKNQLFLQGLGGIRVRLRFPYLAKYDSLGPIALNSVLLVLKNVTTDTTLSPPPLLELMRLDSIGYPSYLVDEGQGTSYFGGTYNKTARTYSFRITRYIQSILQGKTTNLDLYLTVNNPLKNVLDAGRIIIHGTHPGSPSLYSDRLQLQVTYTSSNKKRSKK